MQLCNECGERDDYNIPCKMIRDLDYGLQKEIEENDRYRKALEEIWGLTQSILDDFETYDTEMQLSYCHDISYHIQDIINKAKGEGICQ